MNGLEMVNEQLEVVSRHTDWSRHGELMAGVDSELAELNLQIKTVITLREYVGQLDDIASREILTGRKAPSLEGSDLFLKAIELFSRVSRALESQAEALARQGFRVDGLSRLREIAKDPAAGLSVVQMANAAKELDLGNGTLRETPFDDATFAANAEKGRNFRHLGND
jgi:hypothetical protein